MTLGRIISGGQTGVDRGALDAALAVEFPCGGWCPLGRRAEDGIIPDRYPLQELAAAGYRQRTRQNVQDSDATLVIAPGAPTGGTLQTIEFCRQHSKPHQLIDAAVSTEELASRLAAEFVRRQGVRCLNVAGPRASGWPGGHEFAFTTVARLIERFRNQEAS